MGYVKVINYLTVSGQCDYKGLNMDNIISPIYPDSKNCYLLYNGTVTESAELKLITKNVYDEQDLLIKNAPKPLSESARIKDLEETMAAMLMGGVI